MELLLLLVVIIVVVSLIMGIFSPKNIINLESRN